MMHITTHQRYLSLLLSASLLCGITASCGGGQEQMTHEDATESCEPPEGNDQCVTQTENFGNLKVQATRDTEDGDWRLTGDIDLLCSSTCNAATDVLFAANYGASDLRALKNLRRIEGSLRINNSHGLKNLEGLENLEEIGGILIIENNDNLESLKGLENLTWVKREIIINDNKSLKSIAELKSLEQVGEQVTFKGVTEPAGGSIRLRNNNALEEANLDWPNLTTLLGGGIVFEWHDSLRSIRGGNNITSMRGLSFSLNPELRELDGFSQAGSLAFLSIQDNSALTQCTIEAFQETFSEIEFTEISENGGACN